MKMTHLDPRRGAMLVLVLLVIVILLVCAVFTVDVAQMHLARAELRTATDAAARAGTEALARTQDEDVAIQAALDAAARNLVVGEGLQLRAQDITLGRHEDGANGAIEFVANEAPFSAVRVVGRRDASAPQGTVPLLFANIFGVSEFSPVQTATASASVRDICLVLDRSGSMGKDAGNNFTRLSALQNAVRRFLQEVENASPNARVALVSYSNAGTIDSPLVDEFSQIIAEIDQFNAQGRTNMAEGLLFGSDTLQNARVFANRTIVLMTDGNFNLGGTPVPSAQIAAGRGHEIHTITFSAGANQNIMRTVARIGGGQHIHADDALDLENAFRDIARAISVTLTE